MATHPNGSPQSLTPQDIDAWLLAAAERRAALHIKAASPWPSHYLQDVLTEMSDLLQEALEEVRVMSAQSREESQAVRAKGHALRARAARLLEQSTAALERCASFTPPPPEAIHEAEKRMLELFKGEPRHGAPSARQSGAYMHAPDKS